MNAEEERMRKAACAEEIEKQLRLQRERRPQMTEEDIVKFVFQGMLGVGHLIASPETARARLETEYGDAEADETEPLTERISTEWVRLNLRPAKARGMTAEEIAGYVFESARIQPLPFTRQDVYDFCVRMKQDDKMAQTAANVLDRNWLPSHSEVYRALYRPAYRVLYRELIRNQDHSEPSEEE